MCCSHEVAPTQASSTVSFRTGLCGCTNETSNVPVGGCILSLTTFLSAISSYFDADPRASVRKRGYHIYLAAPLDAPRGRCTGECSAVPTTRNSERVYCPRGRTSRFC